MSTGIEIGIKRLTNVSNMATVLPLAKDKEDINYVLQEMLKELEEGIAEINHLLDTNGIES